MNIEIEYKGRFLEVRRAYWPNYRVKFYFGFIDDCRVPQPNGRYGWVSGFDPRKVEAELKRIVDSGVASAAL